MEKEYVYASDIDVSCWSGYIQKITFHSYVKLIRTKFTPKNIKKP